MSIKSVVKKTQKRSKKNEIDEAVERKAIELLRKAIDIVLQKNVAVEIGSSKNGLILCLRTRQITIDFYRERPREKITMITRLTEGPIPSSPESFNEYLPAYLEGTKSVLIDLIKEGEMRDGAEIKEVKQFFR